MLRIIANRALVAIPTLILVSMMIFGLQKMLPGDTVLALAGEDQNPQVIATLRAKYHLAQPLPVQSALWVRDEHEHAEVAGHAATCGHVDDPRDRHRHAAWH